MRRVLEGTATTVLGGAILWSVTGLLARSVLPPSAAHSTAVPTEARPAPVAIAPVPGNVAVPTCQLGQPATPQLQPPPAIPPAATAAPPLATVPPTGSIPFGSVMLFEDFSRYRDGDATDWGPQTFVKTGLDRRKWLVSNADGAHPVVRTMRLPNEFFFECRYSAYMPETTRGLIGWWRDPLTTRLSLLGSTGTKHTIEWVIGCGNDKPPLNPLGSPPALKYFHSIRLPGAAAHEVGVGPPTGVLRLNRDKNVINVLINGQLVASGMLPEAEQLVGLEIDVVKARSGTLFFTDFKIGR
jgi:hypothetical protein